MSTITRDSARLIIIHDVLGRFRGGPRAKVSASWKVASAVSFLTSNHQVVEREACAEGVGAAHPPGKKYNPYVSVHGERRIPLECI